MTRDLEAMDLIDCCNLFGLYSIRVESLTLDSALESMAAISDVVGVRGPPLHAKKVRPSRAMLPSVNDLKYILLF
jgi:hypothetical protein